MGYLMLEGGAEFGGRMSEPDRRAIELAGGFEAPIRILPAAAAPDGNHERAGRNGVRWFESLGAKNVDVTYVIDRASADDPALAASLRSARLVYLPGGFPRHLGETLAGSAAWQAMLAAYLDGAVIAGSSAGAMVLCQHYYDPYEGKLLNGLNLIPNACVLPHHNRYGKGWAAQLTERLPDSVLIGIDEQTGMISNNGAPSSVSIRSMNTDESSSAQSNWTVYGAGTVTLYRGGQAHRHARRESFVFM
jgi:cyanophycinase